MKKTALICGITGQDGAYLAKFLLGMGYEVWGTSRDPQGVNLQNLDSLGIRNSVRILSLVPTDFRSVFIAIRNSHPDEIYYLAGQSSVSLSFEQPAETMQSTVVGVLNVLEACRLVDYPIRLYHAGSSECFGDTQGQRADEHTPFRPNSPYAVAKASAHWLLDNYRNAYKIHACTGILFNHESPLRPTRFVTKKIIGTAKRIAAGSDETLLLGRLDIQRDWGWAPEYVEAMWRILQQDTAQDFVIATGVTHSLEQFVATAFDYFGLDWKRHVRQSPELLRPTDPLYIGGNPEKAERILGWKAKYQMTEVIAAMAQA
ncbi:GDP-mannose 4,6-dehydratase [Propionivibrio dicarboxylicus]|uniref:GDP-mannose 4,6-dehydratase n=1 Tax=Propionivibrio dicarboxylicus TaxID=83767 RepID=A0A1G8HA71_9RHOO|nr:GDP-mannose 4,6-dehydratase [Propionivibrio dicarboxylicus]SDI03391.1 GDPmannose 4,6-dehydratase [Propionivibrio dicarboxylicus]